MLLKISWDKAQIIDKSDTHVIFKVPYYSKYAIGPTLITIKGENMEDYDLAVYNLSSMQIFIGPHGGLSIG